MDDDQGVTEYVMRFIAPAGLVDDNFRELALSQVGKFFVSYDHKARYVEDVLVTTDDPERARKFRTSWEAMQEWRRPVGVRYDGKLDRPLTFYTIEVMSVEDAKHAAEWFRNLNGVLETDAREKEDS